MGLYAKDPKGTAKESETRLSLVVIVGSGVGGISWKLFCVCCR